MSLDCYADPLRLSQLSADVDPHLIVGLEGEFDIAGAPQFHRFLLGRLHRGLTRVTLDLRGLSFLDSSGVGQLVAVWKLLQGWGTAVLLVVSEDSSAVRTVIRMVHLENAMPIVYLARGQDLPAGG